MNQKNIFLWTLYDFANSIVMIVFFLHFSQWLVIDKGVSDFTYNMIFAIGSFCLLLTTPVVGAIADKTGRHLLYLNRTTLLVCLFLLAATAVTLFDSDNILLALLLFLIGNYFYQFSFVFYNALLHYIAPPEKWGRISGIGQAGNWLGQIVGILIALPFAGGAIYLFGEPGRAQAFLPAVLIFALLAAPMLLFFRLPNKEKKVKISITAEYKNQWKFFRELVRAPGMGMFLLAYFFFNDAVITASNNFPIYMESVFHVSDTVKSIILLGILVTSVIGALFSGWIADRIGLKKTLSIILIGWIILFPLLGWTQNIYIFGVLTTVMGFLFGAVWTVTRAVMTALCPKDKLNYGFSFYTLSERVATMFGPLCWGLISTLLVDLGPIRYRLAVVSMTIFVVIGWLLMRKVKMKE